MLFCFGDGSWKINKKSLWQSRASHLISLLKDEKLFFNETSKDGIFIEEHEEEIVIFWMFVESSRDFNRTHVHKWFNLMRARYFSERKGNLNFKHIHA
jgi:hypothetical protein